MLNDRQGNSSISSWEESRSLIKSEHRSDKNNIFSPNLRQRSGAICPARIGTPCVYVMPLSV